MGYAKTIVCLANSYKAPGGRCIAGREVLQTEVFTIGHSTHTREEFVALLKLHGITALCDVRSRPYSRYNPQFNRETLQRALLAAGIEYAFLGRELGARSEDPSVYEDGKARYDLIAQTALFREGLERVREGAESHRLALMCAEKEPLECHRAVLISRHLTALGMEVSHILADGKVESHADALDRLARMLSLPECDLFRTHEDVLADAYRSQEERIAYDAGAPAAEDSAR